MPVGDAVAGRLDDQRSLSLSGPLHDRLEARLAVQPPEERIGVEQEDVVREAAVHGDAQPVEATPGRGASEERNTEWRSLNCLRRLWRAN